METRHKSNGSNAYIMLSRGYLVKDERAPGKAPGRAPGRQMLLVGGWIRQGVVNERANYVKGWRDLE